MKIFSSTVHLGAIYNGVASTVFKAFYVSQTQGFTGEPWGEKLLEKS